MAKIFSPTKAYTPSASQGLTEGRRWHAKTVTLHLIEMIVGSAGYGSTLP